MELHHELTLHASLGTSLPIGRAPMGRRAVAVVDSGWVRGERITGTLVGPGADWALVGDDGWIHVDVRAQIRTDDGAHLFISYTGELELNDASRAALAGGETGFGDQMFRTHVRIESGDERYRWVNRTLFVGEGRLTTDGVEYEVYRLG